MKRKWKQRIEALESSAVRLEHHFAMLRMTKLDLRLDPEKIDAAFAEKDEGWGAHMMRGVGTIDPIGERWHLPERRGILNPIPDAMKHAIEEQRKFTMGFAYKPLTPEETKAVVADMTGQAFTGTLSPAEQALLESNMAALKGALEPKRTTPDNFEGDGGETQAKIPGPPH